MKKMNITVDFRNFSHRYFVIWLILATLLSNMIENVIFTKNTS